MALSLCIGARQLVRLTLCGWSSFEFSVSDSYMLVFTPGKMYVFKDGALVTDINGSAAMIFWLWLRLTS